MCGVLLEEWAGQGLTLRTGPRRVGQLSPDLTGMLSWKSEPRADRLNGGTTVCGCLLRTQQCVELVCSDEFIQICCCHVMVTVG